MKKLRNVLLLVLAFVIFGDLTGVRAEGKVKVYIFEAGGCPYCEKEIEYLEGLSSYGEKFEIVRKELYVDHVDWKKGSDYELGKTVAEAFKSAGFENASYEGTPFVVISDVYAVAAYSSSLESYIDKAYEEGDKDVVSCYANGGTNCLEGADPNIIVDPTDNDKDKNDVDTVTTVILLLIIAGSIALVIYTGKRNSSYEEEQVVEIEEEKPIINEEKKVTKKVAKKPTNKKKK